MNQEYRKQAPVIAILGPPGAGKTTQAERLARSLGVHHLSTGRLVREAVRSGVAGEHVERAMHAGRLVPEREIRKLLMEKYKQDSLDSKGAVLDGFPRSVEQARWWFKAGMRLPWAVFVDIPREHATRRLGARLVHEASGRLYNEISAPPKVPGRDDVTGEELVRRADDDAEVGVERWREYEEGVGLLRKLLEEGNIRNTTVLGVSGLGSIQEVEGRLRHLMEACGVPGMAE